MSVGKTVLKPCPFCGGEAEIRDNRWRGVFVRCSVCHIGTQPVLHQRKDAPIRAWNRRVEEMDKEASA